MPQHDLELIMLRQSASYLATPIFMVDGEGTLIFYNEPAEVILGRRYDEVGSMVAEEWGTIFQPLDDDGDPLPPESLPLSITIAERHPAAGPMTITGLDGQPRRIIVTAIPLIGQSGRDLGSLAVFWEEQS
jgi:PAS domain-containing protein